MRHLKINPAIATALSNVKVDPAQPWTGTWVVEGANYFSGLWHLEQTDKTVSSTERSYYKINGEVKGNQLKGRIKADANLYYPIVIDISSDGLSFKGTIDTPWRNSIIKGKKELRSSEDTVSSLKTDLNEP
jgi:hypothetical protein